MFERVREAIEAMLDSATVKEGSGNSAALMREAVIGARVSLDEMRSQLNETEKGLAVERKKLHDAERRGELAQGIDDRETVEVAERFAAKHRARVEVLQEKSVAQRKEIDLAEGELAQMRDRLKEVRSQSLGAEAAEHVESAWRNIESAGGARPGLDLQDELLRSKMDSAEKEARADEQLRDLKKKMGR